MGFYYLKNNNAIVFDDVGTAWQLLRRRKLEFEARNLRAYFVTPHAAEISQQDFHIFELLTHWCSIQRSSQQCGSGLMDVGP